MDGCGGVKERGAWVEGMVKEFIGSSPANTLKNAANDRAWGEPLVGFSRGDDPLYASYKENVGPFHWTPREAFTLAFPRFTGGADELTVISWALPQTERAKADLRKAAAYPPESCFRTRMFGEEANEALRRHVVETLRAAGIEAVAPTLMAEWSRKMSERFGFACTWSERHAAHASGLGTFCLTDALITPVGQAVRFGSVIARLAIPPTPRRYTDSHAYCLFFSRGKCGQCIQRCPAQALTEAGHDKLKCRAYLDMTKSYVPAHFGFEGYGCGFCQTGVPCESRIPLAEETR